MTNTKKSAVMSLPVKISVALILLALVIFPIIRMFSSMTGDDLNEVISSPSFSEAVLNSLLLSAAATVICIVLGVLLAFCVVRSKIAFAKGWNIILTLPMLIPSISHGMGLIILFGGNGILKNLFGLQNSIYGPVGIITGSVLYAFPVAYIMLSDVLKYEDLSVYEAADVLGIGKVRQFFHLTLPYLKKPLIATAFSVFSMIITDYGVPLMIGGKTKTLSILMYEEVIGRLDFGRGCVYGLFLLIPAIVAFLADIFNKDRANSTFITRGTEKRNSPLSKALSYLTVGLVSMFALLPIAAFVILAFARSYPRDMSFTLDNVTNTLNRGGSEYLVNSLLIALIAAFVGTALAYLAAYLTSRMKSPISKFIHLLVLTFMAIPGIVLGLSYVITFSGSVIYGTLFIMIMVNVSHFISSPYLMMYNSLGKMNQNLESVGQSLGISRARMIKDVFLPQNAGTLAEMFSYLFVNCMMTISAVSFLANINTKPISLMITQFEAQMQYECAAVVALMILLANILLKSVIGILKHALSKKERTSKHDFKQKAI